MAAIGVREPLAMTASINTESSSSATPSTATAVTPQKNDYSMPINALQALAILASAAAPLPLVKQAQMLEPTAENVAPPQAAPPIKLIPTQLLPGINPIVKDGSKNNFPVKLHQMLTELEQTPEGKEIACFLEHGRAFTIRKNADFVRTVMPRYFKMSRFTSFQRQLNLYCFKRIREWPDRGAYSHPMFLRGHAGLASEMKRKKVKGLYKRMSDSDAK